MTSETASDEMSREEARIADVVRGAGTISRAELARRTGLSRTALSPRLGTLLELGLLQEVGRGPSSGGRPPALVRFAEEGGFVVGIDLGARAVDVAVTNLRAEPVVHRAEVMDVVEGPEEILGRISEIVDEMLDDPAVDRARVKGIGVGIPAPVEFGAGHSVSPQIMPGWEGFDVGRYFYERHGYPVFVDNDANLMALGEAWAGVAVAVSDFLWVKLGSGIGCGIMSAGRLLRGANGSAGDIGHIRVGVDETPCGCGSLGCLEAIAGGDALSARAELLATSGASPILARLQGEGRPLTPVDVAAAVAEGDRAAIELVRSAAAAIGSVLAGVVNFYNPELIVIGGVVARIGDLLLAAIRESVYRESLPLATRELAISGTALGGLTGVVGAAALVLAERFQFAPLVAAGGGR